MPGRIENYALIGDCQTAALVGRDGSIDWLCWPRFDSDACFAALLGTRDHGRWQIAPRAECVSVTRRYRSGTLILETDFETTDGAVSVIDFMPIRHALSDLVRVVVGRRGSVEMRMELILRFNYGVSIPWASRLADGAVQYIAGPDMVVLRALTPVKNEDLKTVASFVVKAGETLPFVLTHIASHMSAPAAIDPLPSLDLTEAYWQQWSRRCALAGEWSEAVLRSLITLKALTYEPTGGIIAAVTTSLPEALGGVRNWDYRFCWLRDATFTLLALMNANYFKEAEAWRA